MRTNLVHFGAMSCFDNAYKKYKGGGSIALFVSVNHRKQTTMFGAALL